MDSSEEIATFTVGAVQTSIAIFYVTNSYESEGKTSYGDLYLADERKGIN